MPRTTDWVDGGKARMHFVSNVKEYAHPPTASQQRSSIVDPGAFLVLNLGLDIVNHVGLFHFGGGCLVSQGLWGGLRSATWVG